MKNTGLSKKKKTYRQMLWAALAVTMTVLVFHFFISMDRAIPDDICIFAGQEEAFSFSWPVKVELDPECVDVLNARTEQINELTISPGVKGNYQGKINLFGLINYKNITFHVIEEQKLMPCGKVVGLYVHCDGILVLGTGEVENQYGEKSEPAKNKVKSGDYIEKIDGVKVKTIEDVSKCLSDLKKDTISLVIRRDGTRYHTQLNVVFGRDKTPRLGIWIREDTQGIGTVTYVDENNGFGALGHGISDSDTGNLMEIADGNMYDTKILKLIKGQAGSPGELMGMIDLSNARALGYVDKNTELGIYGRVNTSEELVYNEETAMPIGLKQNVHKGKASILCQLDGQVQEYEIQIEEIDINDKKNKSMVLRVSDEELLKKTGGIIQGMSGSVILQDEKIIGAVTHVFVNDPTRGYGVFIENMLQN